MLINVFFSNTIFNSVGLFVLCIALIKKLMRFFFSKFQAQLLFKFESVKID